jgi:hypothetical protein
MTSSPAIAVDAMYALQMPTVCMELEPLFSGDKAELALSLVVCLGQVLPAFASGPLKPLQPMTTAPLQRLNISGICHASKSSVNHKADVTGGEGDASWKVSC